MSFINANAKEIHCKIVYYGPSLGGKTTNVQWVYQQTRTEQKNNLVELSLDVERTLFFDFLPMQYGDIRGYRVRFHLYSVPGQVIYDASRRLLLTGLDGVIFVADAQKDRMDENLQAKANLEKNLAQQGTDIRQLPMVVQYNKVDLKNTYKLPELRSALNPYNVPDFEAVAYEGKGVMESLNSLSNSIISVLKGGNL